MIARQSHTKPLAGGVDGIQTALGCNVMLHYVLVNRKFNELKSVILLNSAFVFLDLSKTRIVAGEIRPRHWPQNKALQEMQKLS